MESGREQVTQGGQVVQGVSQSLAAIIQLVQELNQEAREAATASRGSIRGGAKRGRRHRGADGGHGRGFFFGRRTGPDCCRAGPDIIQVPESLIRDSDLR